MVTESQKVEAARQAEAAKKANQQVAPPAKPSQKPSAKPAPQSTKKPANKPATMATPAPDPEPVAPPLPKVISAPDDHTFTAEEQLLFSFLNTMLTLANQECQALESAQRYQAHRRQFLALVESRKPGWTVDFQTGEWVEKPTVP